MRKFLLFCVLFGSLRLSSQSINIAEHGNDKITYAIENILNINAKCFYVERNVKACCSDQLRITAINTAGQTLFSTPFNFSGWNYTRKLIKTNDKCLLLLGYSWRACDVTPSKNSILKIDTNGVVLFQSDIQTTSAAASLYTGQMVDITQHPDSSYYAVSPTQLFHYSKTGQFISCINTGSTGINSVLALSNGHLLINSATGHAEVTTSNTMIIRQPVAGAISKFIQTPAGVLYGLTSSGVIEKYSPALLQTGSSAALTPSNFKITHVIEKNDSLFVTGTNINTNAPFYRILDQNFNILYQTQSTYKNVIPRGIAINNNKINIVTEGTSATNPEINFKSLYQFPITGSFVSQADIGISRTSVIAHSYHAAQLSPSSGVVYPYFNISFTVRNYGNVPVNSFYVNYGKPACDWLYFHKFYNTTILPGDSVVLQTGSFEAQPFGIPSPIQINNVYNYTICLFTTIPNASNDIEINNDAYCTVEAITGFYINIGQHDPENMNINLFPNPFNNTLNIHSDVEVRSVSMYNALGIEQQLTAFNGKDLSIDNAGLAAGIYFIKLQTAKGTVIKKVVKE